MMYHIFLFHPSLRPQKGESLKHVVSKLVRSNDVVSYCKENPLAHDFSFWKNEFLNTAVLHDGTTIKQMLLDPKSQGFLGKTILDVITRILKEAKGSDLLFANLKEELQKRKNTNKDGCDIGLILADIEHPFNNIIGCSQDVIQLHINIISTGKFTASKLKDEGKYAFCNLRFSNLNDAEFKDVAKSHPKRITAALTILNDYFSKEFFEWQTEMTKEKALEKFGIVHDEIDGCSSEAYEKSFDIVFELEDGTIVKKRCTPHLKLNTNDQKQSQKYARIYFALPESKDEPIFVGRIIQHAETKKSKGKKKK